MLRITARVMLAAYLLALSFAFVYPPWVRETSLNVWKFVGYHFLFPGPNFPVVRIDWPRLLAAICALTAFFISVFMTLTLLNKIGSRTNTTEIGAESPKRGLTAPTRRL
jgi:ABC-type Fe3+-siderophore transport system permease subunit